MGERITGTKNSQGTSTNPIHKKEITSIKQTCMGVGYHLMSMFLQYF